MVKDVSLSEKAFVGSKDVLTLRHPKLRAGALSSTFVCS